MYATYTYKAGSTASNILADVVKILTGTTNLNSLSTDCVTGSSQILTTYEVAGWNTYDASAGTNAVCISASIADDATKSKYVVIDTNTSGYILLKTYETWNSSTHSGTNLAYNSDNTSLCQRINTTSGGVLYIKSNVRHIVMLSYQGGVWGASTNNLVNGVFESTRRSAWDTISNAYPPYYSSLLRTNTTNTSYRPRTINATGSDITGTNTASYMLIYSETNAALSTTIPLASDKSLYHAFLPISIGVALTIGNLGGDISSLCKIYVTTYNYGSYLDEVIGPSGETYIIWLSNSGVVQRFALRKG